MDKPITPEQVDTATIKVGDMVRMLEDYSITRIDKYPAGYTLTLTPFDISREKRITILTNSVNHSSTGEG